MRRLWQLSGQLCPWGMLVLSVAAHSGWAWMWVAVIVGREVLRQLEKMNGSQRR